MTTLELTDHDKDKAALTTVLRQTMVADPFRCRRASDSYERS